MTVKIITPITQALSEGIITRQQLRELMQRSDAPPVKRLGLWALLLIISSSLIWLSRDNFLIWPAMFIQGVLLVHLFALQHECVHYTVFKTRYLNEWVGNLCGWIILLPNLHFRYEHCDHHTFTHLRGKDPELIPLPKSLVGYFWYLSALPYWYGRIASILRHSLGKLTDEDKRFIPVTERSIIYRDARLMLASYAALLAFCVVLGVWEVLLYFWLLPMALGEPVMRYIRLTEHVGRPHTADMKHNTRTTLVSAPWRFLGWNMNYHAAHHYASSVPYHALPRLHELLKEHVHVEPGGYWGAHKEILAQLTGRQPRCDEMPQQATQE